MDLYKWTKCTGQIKCQSCIQPKTSLWVQGRQKAHMGTNVTEGKAKLGTKKTWDQSSHFGLVKSGNRINCHRMGWSRICGSNCLFLCGRTACPPSDFDLAHRSLGLNEHSRSYTMTKPASRTVTRSQSWAKLL